MKYIQNALIAAFWLLVWQIAAMAIGNNILAVTPLKTFQTIIDIIGSGQLLVVISASMGRIILGLAMATLFGFALGIIAYRIKFLEKLLSPLVVSVKSIPVASIVVLLLIWQGSGRLSVWISLLVAFPIVYTNILEGMKNTDKKMLEMADVFDISYWNRMWYIYRPAIKGYVLSGMKLATGMSVKAGVAAEIIGLPHNSFGEKLYEAKIYLATDELFAWTVIIVAVAFIFEKVILLLIKLLLNVHIPCGKCRNHTKETDNSEYVVDIQNISKKYADKTLFSNLNIRLKPGEKIGIMAPSGAGKTTLFRIILGLEKADTGTVMTAGKIAAVFQEPLLCDDTDVYTNMRMTGAKDDDTAYFLDKMLPNAQLKNNVKTYSLGMKRRCSIMRALAKESDVLIMDEPFASIDEDNKKIAAKIIQEKTKDKTIIIFTHSEEDIWLVGASKTSCVGMEEVL